MSPSALLRTVALMGAPSFVFLLMTSQSPAFAPAPFPKRWPGNMLVNGSFEEGPPVAHWVTPRAGSTEIKGWTVTRAPVDIVGNYWRAAHGSRSIDLHGSPGYGGVSQKFSTTPGRTYLVTFALAGNPDGVVRKKVMGVSAAGKSEEFSFDVSGKSRESMGWQTQEWRFTATENRTTLELFTLMTSDDSCGPAIDDVRVSQIR